MNTMVGCNQTRRMIDEADHPELLPFEASTHVEACTDCGRFVEERARLRSLLASGTRVTVPINFDAVLRSKLAEAKTHGYAWLSPMGYLRLGGATAALVVMVFAAQYAGFLGSDNPKTEQSQIAGLAEPRATAPTPAPVQPPIVLDGHRQHLTTGSGAGFPRRNRYSVRAASAGVPVEITREDYFHEDGGVMLVRGSNGEGDVSLPMVSVGAQSLVYASANAGRRNTRSIGTSF